MEDLHYQMVGGLSSQMIHGESFFEPTRSEYDSCYGTVKGFQNCGEVQVIDGEIQIISKMARLTSEAVNQDRISIQVKTDGIVGIAIGVSDLNAYDLWNWYAGYTIEVDIACQKLRLKYAHQPNKHKVINEIDIQGVKECWFALEVSLQEGVIQVHIDGKTVMTYKDKNTVLLNHYAFIGSKETKIQALSPFYAYEPVEDGVSMRWKPYRSGSVQGNYSHSSETSYREGYKSQSISYLSGEGEIGIENAGLMRKGLYIEKNREYEGYVYVHTSSATKIRISLRSSSCDTIYGSQIVETKGTNHYERLEFNLRTNQEDEDSRFVISLVEPSFATIGFVFLQPGEWGRYKGLPIRKDLALALINQNIKVLRLNGGMIETAGYRWNIMKQTVEKRAPYDGFYDRYCSNTYGVIEHLNFCEAAGIIPIIGLNIEEEVEDVVDFIAYCNANYHEKRIQDGHEKPYHIQYYQVANETGINDKYVKKFKELAKEIWKVDSDITLIPAGNTYQLTEDEEERHVRKKLEPHIEITRFVLQHGKKILWDAHSFSNNFYPDVDEEVKIQEKDHITGAYQFSRWLTKLEPSFGTVKVGLFELNAGRCDHFRGLLHGLEMNKIHRMGSVFTHAAMPNMFQPSEIYQTDWKAVLWTQGSIYYHKNQIWFQSAYYVDEMIYRNWAGEVVGCDVEGKPETLDVIALRKNKNSLIIRLVNVSKESVSVTMHIEGWEEKKILIESEYMTGELESENTLEKKDKIKPIVEEQQTIFKEEEIVQILKPYSFYVIQMTEK